MPYAMDDRTKEAGVPLHFTVANLILITTSIAILAAIGRLPEEAIRNDGKIFRAYIALLTIYAWRSQILAPQISRRAKWCVTLASFLVCLPYIYLCVGSMFNSPFNVSPTKWIGTPIWIYSIPFASFFLFDLRNVWTSRSAFVNRTMIEILLFFPWTFFWGFTQLLALDAFWR